MDNRIRIGVVVSRYGPEVLGGAETFARELVEHLPRNEFVAEVLTTCAQECVRWENVYPPGLTYINDIPVRRFPIDHHRRNLRRFAELSFRIFSHHALSIDEQYEWVDQNAHSPELYAFLANRGRHFDFIIFVPYVFGSTYYGVELFPEKSIVWACLHDEPFAYLQPTKLMMEACQGLMFTTRPEQAFALDKLGVRHPNSRVVGFGLDDFAAEGARFRRAYKIDDPFILYAGRVDLGKNILLLINCFQAYKKARPQSRLKLLMMGTGQVPIPDHPDIKPLGFMSGQEKLDAFAAAAIHCQPSEFESFSIVIMESWLAGVPVLVHGDCHVTRSHVARSKGGLYFTNEAEFIETVDWLLEQPEMGRRMGRSGRTYVLREYNWAVVLDRFRAALRSWSGDFYKDVSDEGSICQTQC